MEDALAIFALATAACSVALVIWIAGRVWLRAKELDRPAPTAMDPGTMAALTELLAKVDERLGRLEQSVDATAIEVERIAEAQRFAARALTAGEAAPGGSVGPTSARPLSR